MINKANSREKQLVGKDGERKREGSLLDRPGPALTCIDSSFRGISVTSVLVILAILALLAVFEHQRPRLDQEFTIRFGIIEEAEGYFDVTRETNRIPLLLQDTGFCFGYAIEPPDARIYSTHELMVLPAPPKHLGFPELVEKREGGRILRTASVWRQYQMVYPFCFSEGDPLGPWRLEVYIDDQLARTFRFEVVRPEAESWRPKMKGAFRV